MTVQDKDTPVKEVFIPIDYSQHDFQFTRMWFRNRNCTSWGSFLKPEFGGGQPINMIQIGVFEGQDLVWCCQNLLTHQDSCVVAIDPWLPTTKLDEDGMNDVYERAIHNLSPWKKKVEIIRGKSEDILPDRKPEFYDLIVIDGDHMAEAVYRDAIDSLRLLKKGGWMVFDDVRNRITKEEHVQQGLDRFLEDFGNLVKFEFRHRFVNCYSKV